MIEINLMPKELIKKKVELPSLSILPVVIAILAVHLILAVSANLKAGSLVNLEKKWQEIAPENEKAEKIKSELTSFRNMIDAIGELIQGRTSWGKKLSDLSDAMIPGVWLNKLWLEQKIIVEKFEPKNVPDGVESQPLTRKKIIKSLHIEGSVIATGGEETAEIGRFIRSLKNNAAFFADFKDIEATSIQRSRLKELEVMDFELVCYFKD